MKGYEGDGLPMGAPEPLLAVEIGELSELFSDWLAARQLLRAAGFPTGRTPSWRASNPVEFWTEVSWLLGSGILPDGREILLREACKLYPANPVFVNGLQTSPAEAGGLLPASADDANTTFSSLEIGNGTPPLVAATGTAQFSTTGPTAISDPSATAYSGVPLQEFLGGRHEDAVLALATAISSNGRLLVLSAGADSTVRRWDAVTGDAVGSPLRGHQSSVTSVAVTSLGDGRTLVVSGGADSTIRRWDAVTGDAVGTPLTGHLGWVWTVALVPWPPDRIVLVSGSTDNTVRLWDMISGRPVGNPMTVHAEVWAVTTVVLSERQLMVCGGDADGQIRFWRISLPERW